MENDFHRPDHDRPSPDRPSRGEAAEALASLDADRERLATGARVPWSLLAALGGVGAWWVGAGIVAACTVLFSVSLGLVASGLEWAVAFTSLAGSAATTWLAGVAYRSAFSTLRRG